MHSMILTASVALICFAGNTVTAQALDGDLKDRLVDDLRARVPAWREELDRKIAERDEARRDAADASPGLAPHIAWVERDRIRTTHTPMATSKLVEYAKDFRGVGLNSHMIANWNIDGRAEKIEPDLRLLNEMAIANGFHLFLWTAWYWYPDNADFPDRHAFRYLGKDYRRAIDFQGNELSDMPCPLANEFWQSAKEQAVQSAQWSTHSEFSTLSGFFMDFELYGVPYGRYHEAFDYEKCFCDDCFDHFLQAIGSRAKSQLVPHDRRFEVLDEADCLDDYYLLLTERVREPIAAIRRAVDEVNSGFVLGFYGMYPPLGVFENELRELPNRRFFASWIAPALMEELGSPEVPAIYAPLVTDPELNPFGYKRDALRAYISERHQPVLLCPGYIILPEQSSQYIAAAITDSLEHDAGFWFNELWMLWAYKEDPSKAPFIGYDEDPSLKMESIENYWMAIDNGISNYFEQRQQE